MAFSLLGGGGQCGYGLGALAQRRQRLAAQPIQAWGGGLPVEIERCVTQRLDDLQGLAGVSLCQRQLGPRCPGLPLHAGLGRPWQARRFKHRQGLGQLILMHVSGDQECGSHCFEEARTDGAREFHRLLQLCLSRRPGEQIEVKCAERQAAKRNPVLVADFLGQVETRLCQRQGTCVFTARPEAKGQHAGGQGLSRLLPGLARQVESRFGVAPAFGLGQGRDHRVVEVGAGAHCPQTTSGQRRGGGLAHAPNRPV